MLDTWIARADRVQRRHAPLAVVVAVIRKFGDDHAGRLAATIAYYGFFSLFPLLLVFVTVSSWIIADRPELQDRLVDSALAQFPIIGDSIREGVGQLDGSGLALAIGLVAALWSGLGVIQAMQAALNVVWDVPEQRHPSFVGSRLRSLGLLGVLGLGVVTATLSSAITGALEDLPVGGRVLLVGLTAAITFALFAVTYRLLTVAPLRWRDVFPGAAFATAGWVILQTFGAVLVARQLREASALYGFFGLVIGLLWWMYLLAQIALVGAELNVVLHRQLWPRHLAGDEQEPSVGNARPQREQRLAQDA